MRSAAGTGEATRPVWDLGVRVGHWALVASVALAWITYQGGAWHEGIGYFSLLVVIFRVAWGRLGPRYARFAQFVRSPAATLRYAQQVITHREARYLGHNPLGACMVLALLATVGLTGLTGWLYTTNAFWGDERVVNLHLALAILVLVLAALHVAGVVMTSLSHRENLVAAMIHGRKRAPADDDIS